MTNPYANGNGDELTGKAKAWRLGYLREPPPTTWGYGTTERKAWGRGRSESNLEWGVS